MAFHPPTCISYGKKDQTSPKQTHPNQYTLKISKNLVDPTKKIVCGMTHGFRIPSGQDTPGTPKPVSMHSKSQVCPS